MEQKIAAIQAWRFIAATAVVFSHSYAKVLRTFPEEQSTVFSVGSLGTWGPWGVDLFFVISGFIMTWTTWDHFRGGTLDFWKRRIARIVPVYWVATTLGVLLLLAAPHLFSGGQRFDGAWVAASYAFLPWPAPNGDIFNPVLGLGWTLNYEMYFYAVFGLAILFSRNVGLLLVASFMVLSVLAGEVFDFKAPFLVQNTSWLLLEFGMGIAIAVAIKSEIVVSDIAARVMLVAVGAAAVFTVFVNPADMPIVGLHFSRFALWGIPCAILVYCSLAQNWRAPGWMVRLGDASYSIYIFHIFALPVIGLAMKAAGLERFMNADALIVAMTILAVATGVGCYHFIERPLRYRPRWFSPYRRRTSP